jgi:hypothetical protein
MIVWLQITVSIRYAILIVLTDRYWHWFWYYTLFWHDMVVLDNWHGR